MSGVASKEGSLIPRLFLSAIILTLATSPSASAKERSSKRLGVIGTIHGDPAPSMLGIGAGVNLTGFFRISGGVGSYSSFAANVPRGIYNFTAVPVASGAASVVKPFFFGFAWFFDVLGKAVTTGKVRNHLKYEAFWRSASYSSLKSRYLDTGEITTLGGGGTIILMPGSDLSPAVGAGFASYEAGAKNALSLPAGTHSHLYYKAGADYQLSGGFNTGAGFNFCPTLAGRGCGFYVHLGYFF